MKDCDVCAVKTEECGQGSKCNDFVQKGIAGDENMQFVLTKLKDISKAVIKLEQRFDSHEAR